ncbi:hypothetical protein ONV78_23090 [Hahella sp. CR1]|uniref:hypothetical protein n=1 Tax=Hahella sp. CR1 TaxID=2992807 RepID=UPI0024414567|nr:hypothetical protein [Hahella sp. CR1]MDG9670643.1 hypothetical protein [Hahella sp. CR1]
MQDNLLIIESFLKKLSAGDSSANDTVDEVALALVDSLSRDIGVNLDIDIDKPVDGQVVRFTAQSSTPMLGSLAISIYCNAYIDCRREKPDIAADIMIYSQTARLDRTYDSGAYITYKCFLEPDIRWERTGWCDDEYGDYDAFRELDPES